MEWITIVGSKQANAYRGSIDDISPALTSAMGMGGGYDSAAYRRDNTRNINKQLYGTRKKTKD